MMTPSTTDVFALRERARRRGDRALVRTCDRWLETGDGAALEAVLVALAEDPTPDPDTKGSRT